MGKNAYFMKGKSLIKQRLFLSITKFR